jgi:hypothetical protein
VSSEHYFPYQGTFGFDATPQELWTWLQRVDLFETWWPWMRDVRLRGSALEPGSVLSFLIVPPVPYRMRIEVEVTEAQPERILHGRVSGDLHGWGRLEIEPDGERSVVVTTWDVEVANRAIRTMMRIARPLLLRAQTWAVEVSLRGFRRHLERERS